MVEPAPICKEKLEPVARNPQWLRYIRWPFWYPSRPTLKEERVDFQTLKNLYLSLPEDKEDFPQSLPEKRFCIKKDEEEDHDVTLLASYPRCGNTMLRSYVEEITRIFTGSDSDPYLRLNLELLEKGLEGEGLTDDSVFFVKSHYPASIPDKPYEAQRAVLCIRNPLDAIVSYYNMIVTASHDLSIKDEDFTNFRQGGAEWIELEVRVWTQFHNFWLNADIPIFIVRFEDLIKKPVETMTDVMGFLLDQQDISGTYAEAMVELALKKEKKPQVYKPREGKVLSNKNSKYDEEQKNYVKYHIGDLVEKFGYQDVFDSEAESDTTWIQQHNRKAFELQREKLINLETEPFIVGDPEKRIRRVTEEFPDGMRHAKFKKFMSSRATIYNKGTGEIKKQPSDRRKLEIQKLVEERESQKA